MLYFIQASTKKIWLVFSYRGYDAHVPSRIALVVAEEQCSRLIIADKLFCRTGTSVVP